MVFCDDAWHPAAVVQRGLVALADPRFAFEFVPHGVKGLEAGRHKSALVVVAKANHLCATDQQACLDAASSTAFRQFVQSGGGLVAVHAGTCYKDLPVMRAITGGAFLRHPEQCPVSFELKAGHPLTTGVESFTQTDEHYFMALDDGQAEVFLLSRSEHGRQPAGWTRTEGRGRVCVLTPGHNLEVWLHPMFQKLLSNALHWAAEKY